MDLISRGLLNASKRNGGKERVNKMSEYIKIGKEYKHKCCDCIHFIIASQYCRSYRAPIRILEVKNCKRRRAEHI